MIPPPLTQLPSALQDLATVQDYLVCHAALCTAACHGTCAGADTPPFMVQVCEMASIVTQADIDLTHKMDQAKVTAFEEAVAGIVSELHQRCGAFNGEIFL